MFTSSIGLIFLSLQPQPTGATIPTGGPVALDGQIAPGEWSDGIRLLPEGFELLIKASGSDLLLAVRFDEPQAAGVDLFVDTRSGGILNLHASAQVGERGISGGGWVPWAWGNNRRWASHATSRDPATGRFPEQEAREFRIERMLLPDAQVRLRVSVHGRREIVWPPASDEFDPGSWAPLNLPPVVRANRED
jgi:hypothetical protein